MNIIISNCSSGKDYVEIEATWLNVMPIDLRTRLETDLLDGEGYCNVKMTIRKEDYSKLDASCIINLCVHESEGCVPEDCESEDCESENDDSMLLVDFYTSGDVDCMEER